MTAKNIQKAEVLRKVSAWYRTPPTSGAKAPTAWTEGPSGAWKNFGALKEAPTFTQPITSNTIDFADKGAHLTDTSRDSVTITLPVGQFDADTLPLIFGDSTAADVYMGGGDAALPQVDILVQYEYSNGTASQLFFSAANNTNIGDYQPTNSDGANVPLEFTADSTDVLNGKAYARFNKPAAA